jgi:hypothetical protein
MEGNSAFDNLIQDHPRIECLYLASFRRATVKSVVTAVVLLLPVLFEQAGTIPPPHTMRKWAVHEIWDVCQFVSVQLLPTRERSGANGASPAIPRAGNECCGGALDKGGRREYVWLRLGVLSAG